MKAQCATKMIRTFQPIWHLYQLRVQFATVHNLIKRRQFMFISYLAAERCNIIFMVVEFGFIITTSTIRHQTIVLFGVVVDMCQFYLEVIIPSNQLSITS